MRLFYLLLLSVLLYSCADPYPELADIPVSMGIGLSEACSEKSLGENMKAFEDYDFEAWMIEIPLERNNSIPYYEPHSLDLIVARLQEESVPYDLHFKLNRVNERAFEPIHYVSAITDMAGLLLRTKTYVPRRVIFSGEWLQEEGLPFLHNFLYEMEQEFPVFEGEIVFATEADSLLQPHFDWETPDVLGIIQPEGVREVFFKKKNQQLSELAKKTGKALLIVQANSTGEAALAHFQEQLKGWEEEDVLLGINLNTLHCKTSVCDNNSHFALQPQSEFLSFLQSYN